MSCMGDSLLFILDGQPKTYSFSNQDQTLLEFWVHPFHDECVCPVTYLNEYIRHTAPTRHSPKVFITTTGQGLPARPMTISCWITQLMSAAGIDTQVYKARTTRHVSSSSAALKGVPMDAIMHAAGWKN